MLSLHIGPYKTGTTTLQSVLSAASERLRAYGVYYEPTVSPLMDHLPRGDDSLLAHHQLAFPFIDSPRALLGREEVRGWFASRYRHAGVTLVSSEALWSVDPRELNSLLALAECEVRIVAVFRCIRDTTLSAWHTAVGEGFREPYERYVKGVVFQARRDFDYEYHLDTFADLWDVTVVDYWSPNVPMVRRLIEALSLPTDAFPVEALDVREHERPAPWFSALLRAVQRDAALEDFDSHARAAVGRAVRGAARYIEPSAELIAQSKDDVSIDPLLTERLETLCQQNRDSAQKFSPAPLARCCGVGR